MDLKTTQKYYDDAERGVAGNQLKDSYKESDSIKTQRPVIESQKIYVWICVVVDWGGFEPPASALRRQRSSADLPAQCTDREHYLGYNCF
jgi:hypothetical protein